MQNRPSENPASLREFSRKEIADLFSVSVETIKRRTADGLLKPKRANSRVITYTMADVAALAHEAYRLNLNVAANVGISPADLGYEAGRWPPAQGGTPNVRDAGNNMVPEAPFLKSPSNEPDRAAFLVKLAAALQKPHIRQAILALVDAAA